MPTKSGLAEQYCSSIRGHCPTEKNKVALCLLVYRDIQDLQLNQGITFQNSKNRKSMCTVNTQKCAHAAIINVKIL